MNKLFVAVTDWVSEFIGTPVNIGFWLLVLFFWTLIFALNPAIQNSNFLPQWFTSQAYNFPLNTVTTVVELFIGFLCAAATNRAEKALREVLKQIITLVTEVRTLLIEVRKVLEAIRAIDEEEEKQTVQLLLLTQNTHDRVERIHKLAFPVKKVTVKKVAKKKKK
jgi:low affinity Fe/Cu permease